MLGCGFGERRGNSGFSYVETPADLECGVGANMVPAPQLGPRDAEAICDLDERIAAADDVDAAAGRVDSSSWRRGNDKAIDAREVLVDKQLVGGCKL